MMARADLLQKAAQDTTPMAFVHEQGAHSRSSTTKRPPRKTANVLLLDNLNDTACSRFDQNPATIHHRITILTDAILGRHIVVCNALFRENRPNSQIFAILVRGAPLFDDIGMKARTLIHTKDPSYAADRAAYDTTHNRTDGACRSFTIPAPRSTPPETPWAWAATGRKTETAIAAAPTKRQIMTAPSVGIGAEQLPSRQYVPMDSGIRR